MPRTLLAPFLLAAAIPAQARLTVSACKDNTLYQDAQGALSNGAGRQLFCGTSATGLLRRGLLTFDLTGLLPPYATVRSAVITLHVSQARGTGTVPVSLHNVGGPWGEGASRAPGDESGGAAAAPGDATWIHRRHPDLEWGSPGGDFQPAPVPTTTLVGGVGAYQFSSEQLRAEVQFLAWLPQADLGWIVVGDESTGGTLRSFASREHEDPALRPRLTLTWNNPEAGVGVFGNICGGFQPDPVGMCHIGNAAFAVDFTGGVPDGLGLLLFSDADDRNPIPLPVDCHLYLDPARLVVGAVVALSQTGGARVPVPIPADPRLMGTWAFLQMLAVDPLRPATVRGSQALILFLAD